MFDKNYLGHKLEIIIKDVPNFVGTPLICSDCNTKFLYYKSIKHIHEKYTIRSGFQFILNLNCSEIIIKNIIE